MYSRSQFTTVCVCVGFSYYYISSSLVVVIVVVVVHQSNPVMGKTCNSKSHELTLYCWGIYGFTFYTQCMIILLLSAQYYPEQVEYMYYYRYSIMYYRYSLLCWYTSEVDVFQSIVIPI